MVVEEVGARCGPFPCGSLPAGASKAQFHLSASHANAARTALVRTWHGDRECCALRHSCRCTAPLASAPMAVLSAHPPQHNSLERCSNRPMRAVVGPRTRFVCCWSMRRVWLGATRGARQRADEAGRSFDVVGQAETAHLHINKSRWIVWRGQRSQEPPGRER